MPTIETRMTEIQEMDPPALRDAWRRHYRAPVRSKYSADPQVSIVQQVVTVTANRSQALVEPQCFPPLRLST